MNWALKNITTNTILPCAEETLLSFGDVPGCHIQLDQEAHQQIVIQCIGQAGLVFFMQDESVCTRVQGEPFFILEKQFILDCERPFCMQVGTAGSPQIFCDIYQHPCFQECLDRIRKNLSRTFEKLKQNHFFYSPEFLSVFLVQLDTFFWSEHSPFNAYHRKRYKQFLLLLWYCVCEYGIVSVLANDPTVLEIMINNYQTIYVEKQGLLEKSPLQFHTAYELTTLIERMCASVGRRIDETTPYCDARLPDGSRVHAIIPPLAIDGSCLTIRKFPHQRLTPADLVTSGSISLTGLLFLQEIVQNKRNILISGGTGSGKTTLLNCLSAFIPAQERIITIEDVAELCLQQPHVIRLESRLESREHKGLVTIRDLIKNALRMRPDRIIVGECRGGEALDMLQAMNTGHDGSMTTVHANSPQDALRRLETLVLFAQYDLPVRAIREHVAAAIHYVVQQSRLANGKRCVTGIHRVDGLCEQGRFLTTPVCCLTSATVV